MQAAFEGNLTAQGSSFDAFLKRVGVIVAAEKYEMRAKIAGHLSWDLGRLREVIGNAQGDDDGDVPGDEAGVVLCRLGGMVEVGDLLASVRGPKSLLGTLHSSVSVLPVVGPPRTASDGESK